MENKNVKQIDLDKLSAAVENSGLSQRELAVGMGVSVGFVSMMLSGKRHLKIDTLNDMLRVAQIDINDVVVEVNV